jgi:hypothetical protein
MQPGKHYQFGKFQFEHQQDGRWGVSDRMRGVGNCRTPIGAMLRYWREPHVTVRIQDTLIRLHLYRQVMHALHRFGQCFRITKPGPRGERCECTWCGNRLRLRDPATEKIPVHAPGQVGDS